MESRQGWLLGVAVLLAVLTIQLRAQPGGRHLGGDIKFSSGQNVQPVFQGWSKNPDGSFTMHFGYLNRNYVEELHVPVGPENYFDPGPRDRGQPTYFYPAFNRSVFSVIVPGDWGKKELVWTLTVRGKTDRAVAWLQPEWEIDAGGRRAADDGGTPAQRNAPPTLAVEAVSVLSQPGPLALTATVSDDGLPLPGKPRRGGNSENPPAFRPQSAQEVPVNVPQLQRRRPTARTRLTVAWLVWRGPAGVVFDPPLSEVQEGGRAAVTATFTTPGEYVIRARASDTALSTITEVRISVRGAGVVQQ